MDIKILKPGDKVLVECTVQAVFANSKMVMVTTRDCTEGFDAYVDEIQEPKTGHWIDTNDDGFVYHRIYKCSHCGATVCEYPQNMHESKYKYCSSCGAKMVEPQESEEQE